MNDARQKRIYSKNLVSYIILTTNLMPNIERDNKGFFYATFIYCEGVNQAIKQYRDRRTVVNLRDYTDAFHQVNEFINRARRGER